MELINDWIRSERIRPQTRHEPQAPVNLGRLSDRIGEALKRFEPHLLSVYFYDDVGYPWIRVTSDETIKPGLALDIGDAGSQGFSHCNTPPTAALAGTSIFARKS